MQVNPPFAYAWPRRYLVRRWLEAMAEVRELREAAVRRAKDNEALRADLRRERQSVADLAGLGVLEHVGYAHQVDGSFLGAVIQLQPCPLCHPVFLGPPTKEQTP
jgi:hypothetical protein